MPTPTRLLLVGCGKMGSALLKGWQSSSMNCAVTVVDPVSDDADVTSLSDCKGPFDCVVLAVKPQVLDATLHDLAPLLTSDTLLLSIAAGKTIATLETAFDAAFPVIRTMPNTPAAIGCGMTVLCANNRATDAHKSLAQALLGAVGSTAWIDDESLMDAVTAVSGSGPAYVFALIEAMAEAGAAAGLSPELSMTLARATVIGSGALADASTGIDAAMLRKNVTSPGGTTEAALKVLLEDGSGLTALMTNAVLAAQKRGQELAKAQ